MKKLKYLLFLFTILLITDVNAVQLGTPSVYGHFNDDSLVGPTNATIESYFNDPNNYYYKSPYLMGGVSSQQWINQIDFNFNNANLCVNDELSISGSVAGISFFFSDQSYTFEAASNNTPMTCSYSFDWYGTRLNYNCYGQGGGTLSLYLRMISYNQPTQYTIGVSRDMTVTCDASNLDVIANATQNTQNIINNQNSNTNTITQNQDSNTNQIIQDNQQNTQDIIDNQSQNTQDIIDNQNQNTQQEIESQQVCKFIDKNNIYHDNKTLRSANGNLIDDVSMGVTDYININKSVVTVLTNGRYGNGTCFYNVNKELISCISNNLMTSDSILSIPANSVFMRATIEKSTNRPTFKICSDGNQALNDSVNGLNDSITNSNTDNPSSSFSSFQNMLPENGVITQLITLPISLFQKILTSLNSTCSNFNLGSLYNHELILPCINISNYVGSSLWNVIDILFSGFFVLVIAKKMIATFENFSSMKEGDILD